MSNCSQSILFSLKDVQIKAPYQFPHPISLEMGKDENWIVYGNNGSGKTFLIKTIMSSYMLEQGQICYDFSPSKSPRICDNILYLTFHDQYSNQIGSLYQLRWNQGLLGELESEGTGMPRVKDVLDSNKVKNIELQRILEEKLDIKSLMEKYVISLSSGEFRRFQIAQIILKNPRLLIIENPFIGLDEENRLLVSTFLQSITKNLPIQIVLVLSRLPKETEGFSHLIHVENGCINKTELHEDTDAELSEEEQHDYTCIQELLPRDQENTTSCDQILKLNNVSIRYGSHTILDNISWEVKRGEKWALKGKNGSGKSTLLSIICADNPQSYSCDVTLFGNKRGSGESIWDIKKHIGYISPEMFRSYRKPLPVENIVASGLYDTIGLFKQPKDEDFEKITTWLRIFRIENYRKRNYMELSDGEQRLVLLTRAFVKNPDLLILDEPFHGMDGSRRLLAKNIIEEYCTQPGKTLIMVSHYQEDFPECLTDTLTLNKK